MLARVTAIFIITIPTKGVTTCEGALTQKTLHFVKDYLSVQYSVILRNENYITILNTSDKYLVSQ